MFLFLILFLSGVATLHNLTNEPKVSSYGLQLLDVGSSPNIGTAADAVQQLILNIEPLTSDKLVNPESNCMRCE